MISTAAVTSPGPIRPAAASNPAMTAMMPRPTFMIRPWIRFSVASEVLAFSAAST
ncbi:hypothetical protein D3C80_1928670 [compost metagenome]